MSDPFGVCVVGCGAIARFHARALMMIPGAAIVALVSRNPANAAGLHAETGLPPCPAFATLSEALAAVAGIDLVLIATPSGAHLEPALEAAAAGKHVVVEKPLEITPERCEQVIQACDAANVRLGAIFPSRYADSSRALKTAVDAGRFGRITLAETACKWWRSQAYYDEGGWKGTQALDGGGALMNQAIHSVDLLLWLMGEPTHVSGFAATLAHNGIEVEDTAVAVVRFRSGALGVIQAATSVFPGYPKQVAVHGDRGSAVIEQDDVLRWDFRDADPGDDALKARFAAKSGASGGAADPKAISPEGHRRQLADFIDAVKAGHAPTLDGREGAKAVRLICAIYESQRSGRAVELSPR